MGKKKTDTFELYGGPYDGLTYDPATQAIGSVYHTDAPPEGGTVRSELQADLFRVSYDSDSEVLEVQGPSGTVAHDRVFVARKSRWAYRKGSLRAPAPPH